MFHFHYKTLLLCFPLIFIICLFGFFLWNLSKDIIVDVSAFRSSILCKDYVNMNYQDLIIYSKTIAINCQKYFDYKNIQDLK